MEDPIIKITIKHWRETDRRFRLSHMITMIRRKHHEKINIKENECRIKTLQKIMKRKIPEKIFDTDEISQRSLNEKSSRIILVHRTKQIIELQNLPSHQICGTISIWNNRDSKMDHRVVFERVRNHNIIRNPKTFKSGLSSIEYVGHTIDQHGIRFSSE